MWNSPQFSRTFGIGQEFFGNIFPLFFGYVNANSAVFNVVQQKLPITNYIFYYTCGAIYKYAVYCRQIAFGKRKSHLDIQLILQSFGKQNFLRNTIIGRVKFPVSVQPLIYAA